MTPNRLAQQEILAKIITIKQLLLAWAWMAFQLMLHLMKVAVYFKAILTMETAILVTDQPSNAEFPTVYSMRLFIHYIRDCTNNFNKLMRIYQ